VSFNHRAWVYCKRDAKRVPKRQTGEIPRKPWVPPWVWRKPLTAIPTFK